MRRRARSALRREVQTWIADCHLRGTSPAAIAEALAPQGIEAWQVEAYLARIARDPAMAAARELATRARRLEWHARVQREMLALTPAWTHVERLPEVSRQVFLERYYSVHRPLVLTETMRRWPALERWTPAYLKERCGDAEVEVACQRTREPLRHLHVKEHSRAIRLADFIDWVETVRDSDEMYMVAHNNGLGRPELRSLVADIEINRELLDPDLIDGYVFLWYGPGGTVTPLHHDINNILFHQVVGRKRFRLISPLHTSLLHDTVSYFSQIDLEAPDLQRFPHARDLRVLEVELGPGEALFIPAGWWHHVRSQSVSLSLSMTNFVFPNEFGSGR